MCAIVNVSLHNKMDDFSEPDQVKNRRQTLFDLRRTELRPLVFTTVMQSNQIILVSFMYISSDVTGNTCRTSQPTLQQSTLNKFSIEAY